MKLRGLLFSVFAGLAFSVAPANAALVTYLSQGTWLAAVGSVTTADFNDAVTGGGFTKPGFGALNATPTGGITVDTILFQVYNASNTAIAGAVRDPGGSSSFQWTFPTPTTILGDYIRNVNGDSTGHMHITLPGTGATAWSTLFGFSSGSGGAPTISINGVACATCLPTANSNGASLNAAFFGVTSDTLITTVDIYFPGAVTSGYLMIDDFAKATANVDTGGGGGSTPEACTLILTASALVAFAKMLRRMKLGQSVATA